MYENAVKVNLKVLILDDLYNSKIIDKNVYEKALKRIREEEL